MSLSAVTGSGNTPDIRGAATPARAGSVAASLAAHSRFDVLDAIQLSTRQATPQARPTTGTSRFAPARDDNSRAGGDQGGSRPSLASSAFLAQVLAQDGDTTAIAASASQSGSAAYAQAAGRSAPSPQDSTPDVLLPLQPSLNSGRTLDLSV